MDVSEYKDELDGFAYAVTAWHACACDTERAAHAVRLLRIWERIARTEQPPRLSSRQRDRANLLLAQAAAIINAWKVEVDSAVQ